jgi:hypothetical protein
MSVRTILSHLTNEELLRQVIIKNNPTDLEIELAARLEQLMDEFDAWGTPIETDSETPTNLMEIT